jgi:hypothetical protein
MIELLGVKQRDKDKIEKADVANMSSTMDNHGVAGTCDSGTDW